MAAARTRGISPALISKGSLAREAQSGLCVEICLHRRAMGSARVLPPQTHTHTLSSPLNGVSIDHSLGW